MEGNLKDYIKTQSFLYFDIDSYLSIMERVFSAVNADCIKVDEFCVRFGLQNNFFDIFQFLFNANNLSVIKEFGLTCKSKQVVSSL